jgi:hypothetical protein
VDWRLDCGSGPARQHAKGLALTQDNGRIRPGIAPTRYPLERAKNQVLEREVHGKSLDPELVLKLGHEAQSTVPSGKKVQKETP